jgi:histidine triad (HIT) family protein
MQKQDCIFCKIIAKQVPTNIIQENESVIVIKDIAPKTPIHYLIIPKKHVSDIQSLAETDESLAGKLLMMARKLSKKLPGSGDFKLIANSGVQAGQKVFHLHFHFLAGINMGEL